jgi:mRNA interferase YafO
MTAVIFSRKLSWSLPQAEAEKLGSEFLLWKNDGIGPGDFFGKHTGFMRPPSVVRLGLRKVHLETDDVSDAWTQKLERGEENPLKFTSDKVLVYGRLEDMRHTPYLLLTILEPAHDQMEEPEVVRNLGVFFETERDAIGKYFPSSEWVSFGFPEPSDS